MAAHQSNSPVASRLSQLWQLPLFVASLALFAYAAYLFIHPGPRFTLEQKIQVAQVYLQHGRPDAAREQLNRIIDTTDKIEPLKEAVIHLLLAQSLDESQKQQRLSIPENYQRIIQQISLAMHLGATLDAGDHRRLGDSYAGLGQSAQAGIHYRQAIEMDPKGSFPQRRKLIELLIAGDNAADANDEIERAIKCTELVDSERAWA